MDAASFGLLRFSEMAFFEAFLQAGRERLVK